MSTENYEYVIAKVDCDELSWRYKLVGSDAVGRMSHDEDVSEYSEAEIIELTASMLSVPNVDCIHVEYA